jgi:type I restriction enzyme, S subunit
LKIRNVRHGSVDYANPSYVSDETAQTTAKWFTTPGDVLVSMTGSGPNAPESLVGRVARVRENEPKALINQRVGRLRLKDVRRISQDFLFYVLSQKEVQEFLVTNSTGSANQVNISSKTIEEVPCPKIGFVESTGIAAILGALDDRISLLRETNATLEAIAQALFKSWFVDFDPVRAKSEARAPEGMDEATAALFPGSFEDSPLGPIPSGWSCQRLADCCSQLGRGLSPNYVEVGGVLVLNQKCIRGFSVDFAKGRRHDSAAKKVGTRVLEIGDVLVNSTGVGTLGRVAQVFDLPEPVTVDSHLMIVRPKPGISWTFLGELMMSKQAEIEGMGEGSTGQTELSRVNLGSLLVILPSPAILGEFDLLVRGIKRRISMNSRNAECLAQLRDSLLPRLISGQLRVPEAEQEITGQLSAQTMEAAMV